MSSAPFLNKDDFGGISSITEDPFSQKQDRSASLEFMIPPRRKLPFSTTPIPPPPKLSPVKIVSAAPKPQPRASTPTHKPVKKRVASRKPPPAMKTLTVSESEPCALTNKDEVETAPKEREAPNLPTKAAPVRKRATAPVRPTSSSKRSKMVDGSTQTQTQSGHDHTALQSRTSNEIEMVLLNSEVPTPPSPKSPPEHYLNAIDKYITKCKDRPAPSEPWQSPGYEEASETERDVMINDYICENLNDPGFLQLCEDTERAWRRIGLGM